MAKLAKNSCCCSVCATPLSSSSDSLLLICGKCQKHKPYFDKAYSPFLYKQEMVKLVHQFKYQGKLYIGKTLAKLFLQKYLLAYKNSSRPGLIIPVPLHIKRLKHRGFNQSKELALYLSKKLEIPVNTHLVKRIKLTHTQRGLTLDQRKANLKNAFSKTSVSVQQKHIVLVDDVMTTGNTVNEVAKVLKRSGIERVDVWTIARA